MTRSTAFFLAAFLVVLLAVTFSLGSGQDENTSTSTSYNDLALEFKDRIVLFEINRSSALESKSNSLLLHKVRVTKLGSRDFIVGDGYAPEGRDDYWNKDMLMGVPCESIIRFQAMTPAQFAEFMKVWKDQSSE